MWLHPPSWLSLPNTLGNQSNQNLFGGKWLQQNKFLFLWVTLKNNKFIYFNWRLITLQYCWFCHTSICVCHGYTRVPHPEPPSHLPPCTIPLGHLSAPAPSIQYHASNLDWRFVSYMTLYMFQCHSPKSFHPLPLPQSPKDCSTHLCLFCCLAYGVIIAIFLNSIYMRYYTVSVFLSGLLHSI